MSEFETQEQAAAYEIWLAAKVAASLADTRSPVSHDEAMARARAIIQKHKTANSDSAAVRHYIY